MQYELQPDSLVDISFIRMHTGYSNSTIYRKIDQGQLAKPTKLGRQSKWKKKEVDEFMSLLQNSSVEYDPSKMKELAHLSAEKRRSRNSH